jgi:hypothetical protein
MRIKTGLGIAEKTCYDKKVQEDNPRGGDGL